MAVLERPLIVVGDTHFSHGHKRDTGAMLARLVVQHPGAELVLNGDIFNLSLDEPARDPIESSLAMLGPEAELRQALRNHVAAGGRLSVLPGNHDAGLADPGTRDALLAWLELGKNAPIAVLPWFLRRGSVHVEHGHAYDPDNAPTHPLVVPSPRSEPLGVALTRRFVAPNRAFDFAHATEITPLAALQRAFRAFGARTPLLLTRYFVAAGRFCSESGWRPELAEEKRFGDALVASAAHSAGLDPERLQALLESRARPTHESFERAFFRLYFDRVASVLSIGAGVSLGVLSRSPTALGMAALGALYLRESRRKGGNRYAGAPVRRLREASELVLRHTGASLVVFGHTHVPEKAPGYLNPGSFTYRAGEGRPYAYVDETGSASERRIT
jgi:predicted phosphodiesterase